MRNELGLRLIHVPHLHKGCERGWGLTDVLIGEYTCTSLGTAACFHSLDYLFGPRRALLSKWNSIRLGSVNPPIPLNVLPIDYGYEIAIGLHR